MKEILKSFPLIKWLHWFVKYIVVKFKNRGKHLKIYSCAYVYNSVISDYNTIYCGAILNNVKMGKFVYVATMTRISNTTIGQFCSIGSNCIIGLGRHPTDHVSTFPAFFSTKKQCQCSFVDKDYFEELLPIKIGNDVWIGANVLILDGVTIGDGAIIAAGAVVNKDVPQYAIYGGIPAGIIRYRFDTDTIQRLMKLEWWNNDIEWMKNNGCKFHDVYNFN